MKFSEIDMKTALLSVLALAGWLVSGAGCSSVQSKISVHSPQGTITMQLPKDAKFDALIYSRSFVDAAGHTNLVSLLITNGDFKMNPAVVDAKTRHDVEVFKAGTEAARSAAREAAAAYLGVPPAP